MEQPYEWRLKAIADERLEYYRSRGDIVALALTGSLARGALWVGSDVDMWGFTERGDEQFEDGVIDGVYWEIDIRGLDFLDIPITTEPPHLYEANGLSETDPTTPLEALWGCHVVKDDSGKLNQVAKEVQARMDDSAWLKRRAERYQSYGIDYLASLQDEKPVPAIVASRAIATRYGISSYWMRRGKLLTSVRRLPEQLDEQPQLQVLYRAIFNLNGKNEVNAVLAAVPGLPQPVQEEIRSDIEYELKPVLNLGYYDGPLRHLREILPDWIGMDESMPLLGIESDPPAQKQRVLHQTRELLELCRSL